MLTYSDSFKKSILEAAGLQNLTGDEADYAVARILDDHWALDRGWKAACQAFIPDALRGASFIELEALRKRLQPAKATAPVVQWGYTPANDTVAGVAIITATCGAATTHWSGPANKIQDVVIHGAHVPADLQYLYRLHAGMPLPDADLIQQKREQLQYEQDRQNKKVYGGDAALVFEQERLAESHGK